MKNENLLKMLGEIDEKHLNDANRDIERWLEDMSGVKVTVERPKKSPWRLAAALSCSAAAVIGAFVLILNVPKIGNIGNTGNTVNSGGVGEKIQSAAFSERLENYEITNLDYSNAVITENTPASGQWRRLSYAIPGIDENSPDRMAKIAEAYGATINKDDIQASMIRNRWTNVKQYYNEPFSRVYSPEYGELQFPSDTQDKIPYNSIFYSSNDIYIEIAEPGDGWIILDNRKFLNSYFDWEVSYGGVWTPTFHGKPIHYVDLDDEEETVILNGKTVKIADAVKNAQKYFSENTALFPQVFDTKISSATVYNYPDDNQQGLALDFRYYYDGMPYQPTPSDEFEENRYNHKAGVYTFQCAMLTENTVDWIWFKNFDGATEFTIEDCEATVSQEDALKLVSMRLDPNKTMLVREIHLLYGERRTDGGRTSLAEPTWMIVLAENEIWDANKTIAYVSAVDGSVRTFYDRKPIM